MRDVTFSNFIHFSAISTVVLALVNGETERKVPPRTPPQRLGTLKQLAVEWIENNISQAISRPSRAAVMTGRIEYMFSKMSRSYGKKCHFYNPTVLPHGGPNPNSQRKRRAAFAQQELNRIARSSS